MIAYLDNSATTRPTDGVVAAMAAAMREGYFNPSSLYAPALHSERAMRACREAVASAISVDPGHVYFTSGGTEANNLAILGAMASLRQPGRAIAFADQHPSCLEPIAALQKAGHRVTVVGVDGQGQPDWAALDAALMDRPDLVTCLQVNNETGAVPDLKRLIATVRAAAPGALVHVDGVQGFLRVPFDGRAVDLYALSAHKIHGPKGVGALYVAPGARLAPRQLVGGQEGALR
ncbi:MAG: aminotransferase class V-fold PLP-dependent enzyme, partial [Clostridiales bacterium]|nr:aminotransferase class V-fold PLP-dependent enzyme [Clostridiales bacterium]